MGQKPHSMSAGELRDALYRLRLTQHDIAKLTHYSKGQINVMCRERGPIPETLAIVIRLMLDIPGVRGYLFPWKPADNVEYNFDLDDYLDSITTPEYEDA